MIQKLLDQIAEIKRLAIDSGGIDSHSDYKFGRIIAICEQIETDYRVEERMTPIEKALKTWYSKDHPLHLDPLHPAIGLAGEAGELLDLYKKERFKEGVSWWDCVHCNHSKHEGVCEHYSHKGFCNCPFCTPKILDELGDLSYYKRILDHIAKYGGYDSFQSKVDEITILLADLNLFTAQLLHDLIHRRQLDTGRLTLAQDRFEKILEKVDCTLDQLTELNWQKLKDGDNHGWQATAHKSPEKR